MVFIFGLIASCFIKLILFCLHLCCTQWGQIFYELLYFCHFFTNLLKVITFQKQIALSLFPPKNEPNQRMAEIYCPAVVFQRKLQQGIHFAS